MKKRTVFLVCILILILFGCSTETEEAVCPDYFAPVLQEIEASDGYISPVMTKWWVQSLSFSEDYADKIYTCDIEGTAYSFNLQNELTDAEEWYWSTAGIFADKDKRYICLHDYNILYDESIIQTPQLLLIEFSIENPGKYQIYSYTVEPSDLFGWDVVCYCIGDNIYIAGEAELAVINLSSKQLRYCTEENNALQNLVNEKYGREIYHTFLFRAIFEQDDVVIYSAQISEAIDTPAIGMMYIACKDGEIVSYLSVNLSAEQTKEDIKIKLLK